MLWASDFKSIPMNADDDWVVRWTFEWTAYCKAMNWSR